MTFHVLRLLLQSLANDQGDFRIHVFSLTRDASHRSLETSIHYYDGVV